MERLTKLFRGGLVALVLASLLLASQGNPAIGTWKLNLGASDYGSAPPPKSGTMTVETQGDGVVVNYEFAEPEGGTIKYSYQGNSDGKNYPISGSGDSSWRQTMVSGADTIGLRRFGSNASGAVLKKSGNAVQTTRTVVSKNGKVTTITINAVDAKGQPTKTVSVWDKQ
jgi:hypothetical protein